MLYIMDACTVAPLFRGADGPNCKDIMKGIAFSMPSCLCQDTAVFLVKIEFIDHENLLLDIFHYVLCQLQTEISKFIEFWRPF